MDMHAPCQIRLFNTEWNICFSASIGVEVNANTKRTNHLTGSESIQQIADLLDNVALRKAHFCEAVSIACRTSL